MSVSSLLPTPVGPNSNRVLSLREMSRNKQLVDVKESLIRSRFMRTYPTSDICLINYQQFARVFPPPSIDEAYKSENLSVIDMHLRYQQYISQKMSIYKWVPSLIFAAATRFSLAGLVFPAINAYIFDYYLRDFFTWRESSKNLICIRDEFTSKLSKNKNKIRRICKFQELYGDQCTKILGQSDSSEIGQIKKYLKFGENTQYLFHTTTDNKTQESTLFLSTMFENYMLIRKYCNLDSWAKLQPLKDLYQHLRQLKSDFSRYKSLKKANDQQQNPPQIYIKNYRQLLTYQDIKQPEIYNLTKQIQIRIRRFLEIWKFSKTGEFMMSGFSLQQITHLNKHYDWLQPERFSVQSNAPDLVLFYGLLTLPKIASMIIKRSVRM